VPLTTGYRLLDAFLRTFAARRYSHRDPNVGDRLSAELYEDLYARARARDAQSKLVRRVDERSRVLNATNYQTGVRARRGDGTFGEIVYGEEPKRMEGYAIARAPTSVVEIGVESKIISAAQSRQFNRVASDLTDQIAHFNSRNSSHRAITIALIAVNEADAYCSYEGERPTPTTGRGKTKHPAQEAPRTLLRIAGEIRPKFDETIVLRYRATNVEPYPFEWTELDMTRRRYSDVLTNLCVAYEARF
jgi:hypothetical protein